MRAIAALGCLALLMLGCKGAEPPSTPTAGGSTASVGGSTAPVGGAIKGPHSHAAPGVPGAQ